MTKIETLSYLQKDEILKDFKDNIKLEVIKDKFNINGKQLRQILLEKGLTDFKRESYSCKYDYSNINKVLELFKQGFNIRQISEQLNVPKYVIRTYLNKYNIERKDVIDSSLKFFSKANISNELDFSYLENKDMDKVKHLRRLYMKIKNNSNKKITFTFKDFLDKFYTDIKFNKIYHKWIESYKKSELFPSIDHMESTSLNGTNDLDNLQIITWLENRAKNNLPQDEWEYIKKHINDYFI